MQNGGPPSYGGEPLLRFLSFTFGLLALVAYTLIKTPDTIRRRKEPQKTRVRGSRRSLHAHERVYITGVRNIKISLDGIK